MLLDDKQNVFLSDFGLTILASSKEESPAGTPIYMAPEQIQGRAVPASDQYALAIVAYEWLTGQPPFQGSTWELMEKHLYGPVPPMPRLPKTIEAVVWKALAKRSEGRYPGVLDFAKALEAASYYTPDTPDDAPASSPIIAPGNAASVVPAPKPLPPLEQTFRSTERRRQPPLSSGTLGDVKATNMADEEDDDEYMEERVGGDQPTKLSLFALARTFLEKDDTARVGKTYTMEVGIGRRGLDPYRNAPITLMVQDPTQPILFHVLLHASSHIEVLDPPFQPLNYDPTSRDAQFIHWHFRLREAGPAEILVNFYRERQWLRMVRLEVDGVGLALPPPVAKG